MSIFSVGQSPIICSNMTEMGTLLTLYPDLETMTSCTVMSGAGGGIEVYRLQSGTWTRTYPDQATVNWLTQNSTDISTLQTTMAAKADSSSLTSAIATLTAALGGKADSSTVAALSSALSAKADQTDVNKKPYVFLGGAGLNAPKIALADAVVSGGNAVFYLTDTGLSSGTAIFSTSNVRVQPVLFAAGAPPAFAPLTLSADRKTLTIPTTKATTGISVLGINVLGANIAANGDTVSVLVIGT